LLNRQTESEEAAEALMNLVAVLQAEALRAPSLGGLAFKVRGVVDSLCPQLTGELRSRAPGLHASALLRPGPQIPPTAQTSAAVAASPTAETTSSAKAVTTGRSSSPRIQGDLKEADVSAFTV